jgi:DNA-binding transcriptional ArsR family regulator
MTIGEAFACQTMKMLLKRYATTEVFDALGHPTRVVILKALI